MKKKITKYTKTYYNYLELQNAVEELSGRDIRDWLGAENYRIDWLTQNGYFKAKSKKKQEEIYKKFLSAEDGMRKAPPAKDFWLVLINDILYEVYNGSFHYFNPKEILKDYKKYGDINGTTEKWVLEILEYFIQVFKKNKLPDEVEILISW